MDKKGFEEENWMPPYRPPALLDMLAENEGGKTEQAPIGRSHDRRRSGLPRQSSIQSPT